MLVFKIGLSFTLRTKPVLLRMYFGITHNLFDTFYWLIAPLIIMNVMVNLENVNVC